MINKTCHRNHSRFPQKKSQSIKDVYIKVSISIIHYSLLATTKHTSYSYNKNHVQNA